MKVWLFSILMSVSLVGWASDIEQPPSRSTDLTAIAANQSQIRDEVDTGQGVFKDLSAREKREFYSHQDRLLNLIQGKQTLDQLSETEQTELFNELEWVKARVARAEDEQVICEHTKPTGTNFIRRVCRTAKYLRLEREKAQKMLEQPGLCTSERACNGSG